MDRLRTRAAHPMLALGLLLWVIGSWANQLHAYLVVHAVCADHGEIVELVAHDHGATAASDDGPSVGEAHFDDDHDHGCASLLASWHGLPAPPAPPPARVVEPPRSVTFWAQAAPRGPPLAWAPKTSPPASLPT